LCDEPSFARDVAVLGSTSREGARQSVVGVLLAALLARAFAQEAIFEVGNNLATPACRDSAGELIAIIVRTPKFGEAFHFRNRTSDVVVTQGDVFQSSHVGVRERHVATDSVDMEAEESNFGGSHVGGKLGDFVATGRQVVKFSQVVDGIGNCALEVVQCERKLRNVAILAAHTSVRLLPWGKRQVWFTVDVTVGFLLGKPASEIRANRVVSGRVALAWVADLTLDRTRIIPAVLAERSPVGAVQSIKEVLPRGTFLCRKVGRFSRAGDVVASGGDTQ